MGLFFNKNPREGLNLAEIEVRKCVSHRDAMLAKSRAAEESLQAAGEELRAMEEESARRASRGEPLVDSFEAEDRLRNRQAEEKATHRALEHAEANLRRAIADQQQAVFEDASARLDEALKAAVDAFTEACVAAEATVAIFNEDSKRLTSPECQFLIPQMRHWLGLADRMLNPPAPKPRDPNLVTVKFVSGFPGRQEHPTHKRIGAYGAGEVATFDRAQAALLFELGVAVEVKPDSEEKSEAA